MSDKKRINKSIFPNSLTMGNMLFGFLSIIASIKGDYIWASYYVILGGVCDALDGKVARLVKSTSDFGVEFDSLSDLITFGAAPSFLMYMLYEKIYVLKYPMLEDFNHLYIIFSFMPLLFTGIRLARFNAELEGHDKEEFSGLPSPASALTIISFVLFEYGMYGEIRHLKGLTITSVIVSYLMISRITYHGFPIIFKKGEKLYLRYLKVLSVLFILILVVKLKMSLLFPIMILFVLSGILTGLFEKLKKNSPDDLIEGDA